MNTLDQNKLLELENQYWNAMKKGDADTAASLTRFPGFVVTHSGVMQVSEPEFREMMRTQDFNKFEGVEILNPKTEVLGEELGIIAYSVTIEGKQLLNSSTWIRDGENWVCAFHTETPLDQQSTQFQAA